jgi:HK97 family phage portal protein
MKTGLFNKFFNKSSTTTRFELITDQGNGFYNWNGNLYKSDVIRACVRPKAKAIGKLMAKHIRETLRADGALDLKVNPDVYMRFLLEEPNPYMTGQLLQEKITTQLQLNNNAFIYINRDENGYANELYPIPALSAEAIYNTLGELFLKCTMRNGKNVTYPYADIIHLRQDYNRNDIFGESPRDALLPLMEIVNTTDQGIVKAIKNSMVIKWLMKFKSVLRPEDRDMEVTKFVDNFLSIDKGKGVAASDPKYDLEQVEDKPYVPNAAQMDRTITRLYNFFGTNEKIVQSKYTEDEWNAYYESEVEPLGLQLSGEYTRKLFSRRERGFGNSIIFEASNLSYASMATKLNLVQFVDRGMMTPNEVRRVMNLGPIDGGDRVLLRKDTGVVSGKGGENK